MVKDTTYASLFDKKDLPYIYRLMEEVRATHNQDLVNEFNQKCEQRWNDHNPTLNGIEFLQVSKADDLCVTGGLDIICGQIVGSNVSIWRDMGTGIGTTAPAIGQTVLVSEILPRLSMATQGWREFAGTSLRFACIFNESGSTATITECGVFDQSGNMLNRNMFSNFPITHTQNVTGYVLSCVIEFVPVM